MRPLNGTNPSAASTSGYPMMAETNGNGRSANGNGSSNGTGSRPGPSLGGPASSTRLATLMAEAEAQQRDIPLDTNFRWSQENYNEGRRTVDTWIFFLLLRAQLWLLDKPWAYVGGFTEDRKKQRTRSLASWVRESILELGPTFIKLGQLSSTRSDLFASEFVEELSKLQDRVPAFPAETAVATIEAQLGQPLTRMFKEFEMKPIAAASLGQVHRARLWTGEQVAVKIQRPGLKKLFDIDLENLRVLAEQLDRGDDDRDFKGIYEECANILYQEIDYIAEGRNCNRFSRNFRDTPWVVAPKVHWQYSAPRVLTLEYLPGTKVTDSAQLQALSLDPQMIARRATEAYLIQILRFGFFHADPHPGNISVDPQGNLLFYDFGMMGEIVPSVREKLLEVFYGVYKKQTERVVAALVDLEIIKPIGGDVVSIQRAIGYGIENLAVQTERKATAAAIGEDLFAIALDQPFRFPATFTFVLRSFATLEGIGRTLDPDFKFVEVARPYAQELLDLQDAQAGQFVLQELQQQATETATAAASVPMRVQRMAGTMERLEAGDLKLRVRVLEAERAARRSGILQIATMNTIVSVGFLNVGTILATSGHAGPASLVFALSGLFGAFVYAGFKRVGRLDKLEKAIRG